MNLGIFHYAKKSNETYKIILIYDISYKTSMGAKLLHIRFSKIDSFIKIHDQIRYLVLFDYSFCDKIGDKIILLVIEKSSITGSAFETQMLSAWPIKCWGDFRIFQFILVISWQKKPADKSAETFVYYARNGFDISQHFVKGYDLSF